MENYTGHDCEYSGQLQQLKRLTYDKSPNLLKSTFHLNVLWNDSNCAPINIP